MLSAGTMHRWLRRQATLKLGSVATVSDLAL